MGEEQGRQTNVVIVPGTISMFTMNTEHAQRNPAPHVHLHSYSMLPINYLETFHSFTFHCEIIKSFNLQWEIECVKIAF